MQKYNKQKRKTPYKQTQTHTDTNKSLCVLVVTTTTLSPYSHHHHQHNHIVMSQCCAESCGFPSPNRLRVVLRKAYFFLGWANHEVFFKGNMSGLYILRACVCVRVTWQKEPAKKTRKQKNTAFSKTAKKDLILSGGNCGVGWCV